MKVEGAFEVTQIENFFVARNVASTLEVQTEMTNADGTVIEPNYGLGIAGAVIAVIISVVVIFAANYVLYVWMMVEAFGGRYTFGEKKLSEAEQESLVASGDRLASTAIPNY